MSKIREFLEVCKSFLIMAILGMLFVSIPNILDVINGKESYEEPRNGDTRVETYSESDFDTSTYSMEGYQEQYEETYYNGEWIPTEEYDLIIQAEDGYDNDYDNKDIEIDNNELKGNEVLFIYKGYYYHSTIECEGLKDCYDIRKGDITKAKSELGLKACNWCI